jgi:hypothetical protein
MSRGSDLRNGQKLVAVGEAPHTVRAKMARLYGSIPWVLGWVKRIRGILRPEGLPSPLSPLGHLVRQAGSGLILKNPKILDLVVKGGETRG